MTISTLARKSTCSPCLRGHHDSCTTPASCECTECHAPPLIWEDPGDRRSGSRFTLEADVVAALRAHPGRWARVKEYKSKSGASTCAKAINTGAVAAYVKGEWEARGRIRDGASYLYLRFVGKA